ncbi:hypothetical protein J4476_05720 [Candidatus Woesearchaeota archaeon]|nr:MAG: hypothetical protein QT09_C0003G0025 [archaeon GW2011_AR18]MBS3162164.1 hypothetical protein [Candidatus Woesearchaeota archaeon]HIH26242.1 hypothetical protein [Nanoarchaeota archaeon]
MPKNRYDKIIFHGSKIPIIVFHGTTERFVDRYIQGDGSYRPAFGYDIDAVDSNVRFAYPKLYDRSMGPKAVIVINTEKAFLGLRKHLGGSHVKFNFLPHDSFRVIRESDCNFGEYGDPYSSRDYNKRVKELEEELLKDDEIIILSKQDIVNNAEDAIQKINRVIVSLLENLKCKGYKIEISDNVYFNEEADNRTYTDNKGIIILLLKVTRGILFKDTVLEVSFKLPFTAVPVRTFKKDKKFRANLVYSFIEVILNTGEKDKEKKLYEIFLDKKGITTRNIFGWIGGLQSGLRTEFSKVTIKMYNHIRI